ncbi:MAG TPA: PAS domain-containing protein [Myxococcaceae bacterium]|nr:PAS domain-containing protein [Myxococcaceae bacterium]
MSAFSEGRSGVEGAPGRPRGVTGPASEVERLRLVLDTVPAALIYVDAEERYVVSNRFHETHYFRPRFPIQGRTLREVLGEETYARVRPHVRAALEGRTVSFDVEVERQGASPVQARATYTPDFGPDGRVRGFVGLLQDLPAERTLEQTLRRSERRFRHAVEGMLDAFEFLTPVVGADGKVTDFRVSYVNAVAQRYAGVSRERYEGQLITEIFPNAEESGFLAMYRQVWETGDPILEDEYPYQGPGELYGAGVWLALQITRVDEGVAVAWRDVTEQVVARKKVEESEARFRNMADHAPVMLWVTDPSGACVYLNRQWFEYTGQPRNAVLGEGWLGALHPDDVERVRANFRAANEMQVPFRTEYRLRQWDGEYRWFIDSAMPRFDGAGEFVGYIGSVIDIEDRRRAEQALRESERQFRAVVENLPGLAWSALPDGHFDYFNRRWAEYTGRPPETMEGWGWQAVHDPEVLPQVLERWTHSLATGDSFEMEFPLRGADGVFRWFLGRVQPLRDSEGRIVRWFGVATNVDEQQRQAAALRDALAARDTFLSVASHELRTPLTPLSLKLEMLAREARAALPSPLAQRVLGYTDATRRQVSRLSSLVSDLLDVSRIAAGRFTVVREPVDLAAVVREVVARAEPQAHRAGSRLTLDAPDSLETESDRLRFDQVVTNLVDNAIKYGDGKPIQVRLSSKPGWAVLTVIDEGIGIDPDKLDVIFGRYERAVSERHYGGLGLGLYISRTVVESMGGTVSAESERGAGSTFEVRLPV